MMVKAMQRKTEKNRVREQLILIFAGHDRGENRVREQLILIFAGHDRVS